MTSEAASQQEIRTDAPKHGWQLMRNNVGATFDRNGRMIRFGLGNDSEALNEVFKSSDLIGIRPVVVTPEMVGTVIGQFAAVEVKAPGWKQHPSDTRAQAQARFGAWVEKHGGCFQFATSVGDMRW